MTQPSTALPFNGLSPAEAERLDILIEELAEAIQVASKVKRHGWTPTDHTTGISYDNRAHLEEELGHVLNAQAQMVERGDIQPRALTAAAEAKRAKWGPYLHHQND